MSPTSGPTGSVVDVTIFGGGFQPGATVTLDNAVADGTVVSDTFIKVKAPIHSVGTVDVVVTNPGGQSARLPGAYTYTPLVANGCAPRSGLAGQVVGISGSGFAATAVTFDGVAARIVGSTTLAITVIAPEHAGGTVDVVVTNSGGESATVFGGYTYEPVLLTATPSLVTAGAPLSVSWVAPIGRSVLDWIALLKVGEPGTSYENGWWKYTNGAASGTLGLTAPSQPGQYEFRYFLDDGFVEVGRSGPVTVTAGGSSPASPSIRGVRARGR